MTATRGSSSFCRLLLRVEAAIWLTRPQSLFSKVPIAVAAWLTGRGDLRSSATQQVLLLSFLVTFQGLLFAINDINDAERDRRTAPYLPIPAGVLTRRDAIVVALAMGIVFLASLVLLGSSALSITAVLATIPPALATMRIYGRTKATWYSPLLGSTAASSPALWTWLLAGYRNYGVFAVLFATATLHGLQTNLRAQLRDIEGDPKAGTLTLAARLGARRTFWLIATIQTIELGVVLSLYVMQGRTLALLWLMPALGLLIMGLVASEEVYSRTRDRLGQTEALRLWVNMSFATEIAILAAFRPVLALPIGAGMFLWFAFVRRTYYRRLVGRRLERQWKELGGLGLERASGSTGPT